MKISHEELLNTLNYDSESGIFTWLIKPCSNVIINSIAGCIRGDGYISIRFNKTTYLAHRLAWFYHFGIWPELNIDHIDTIKHHNFISNLRECTQSENNQNQTKASIRSKSGFLGVSYDKRYNSYLARIEIDNKRFYLGSYKTPEEAHQVYLKAKQELHPYSNCFLGGNNEPNRKSIYLSSCSGSCNAPYLISNQSGGLT
jgi:hypothetical protein